VITPTTSAPIKRAIVQALRANATLKAQVDGFHEGFAPKKAEYPHVVFQIISPIYEYPWGSAMIYCEVDVKAWAKNSVEADNLDALINGTLQDASLTVDGQSTLICRRIRDLIDQDDDEEGNKIYMTGGSYEIITDQPTE
jgi:hypothetical protein